MADNKGDERETKAKDSEAKENETKAGPQGPDNLDEQGLRESGGQDYAYLDQTRTVPGEPMMGTDVSAAELNPAYYPKNVKPEALHGEAEKAGADYPGGPTPGEVEDQHVKAEDLPEVKAEQEALEKTRKQA